MLTRLKPVTAFTVQPVVGIITQPCTSLCGCQTPALRATNSWYTLHWRPGGGSVVLQQPDNEASNNSRRDRAKAKKQRRREREHLFTTAKGKPPSLYPSIFRAQCTASALVFLVDKVKASKDAEEANQLESTRPCDPSARQCLPHVASRLPQC